MTTVYLPKNTISLPPYPEHELKSDYKPEKTLPSEGLFPLVDDDLPIVPFKRPIKRRLKQDHFKLLPTKYIPSFKQTDWYKYEKEIQDIQRKIQQLTYNQGQISFISDLNQIENLSNKLKELKKKQYDSTSTKGILDDDDDDDFDSSILLNISSEDKNKIDVLFHEDSKNLRTQFKIGKAWLIYWVQSFNIVSQLYPTKEMLTSVFVPYRPVSPLVTLYRGLSFTLSELRDSSSTSLFWDESTSEFGRLITIDKYSSWTYSHDTAEEFADTAALQRDDAIAFIIFQGRFQSKIETFVDVARVLKDEYPMRHEQEVILLPLKNKSVEIYKTNIPPIPFQAKQSWLQFLDSLIDHSSVYRIKFEQDEDNEDRYKIYISNRRGGKPFPGENLRKWRQNSKHPSRIRLDIKSEKWSSKDYIDAFREFLNIVKSTATATATGAAGAGERGTMSKRDIVNKWISPYDDIIVKLDDEINL